jgi:hypothetical protein
MTTGRVAGKEIPIDRFILQGDDGKDRTTFQPGESLTVQLRNLKPEAIHQVTVADGEGELFTTSVASDGRGEVEPTVLWPMMGIQDPRRKGRVRVEDALKRWHSRKIRVTVKYGERTVGERTITLDAGLAKPLVTGIDAEGFVLHGFEVGKQDARVGLYGVGGERVRVWMVPRQHEWRPGDAILPVAFADATPKKTGVTPVAVARKKTVRPGAYDFIVRRLRYGYEDDDLWLRAEDILGGRWTTGLVVREPFMPSKMIHGGCVNEMREIAGRSIGIWPYMKFTNVFQVGENIWGALDPAALDPQVVSKMVAIYVVNHKTQAQWNASGSLTNLPQLGGNPSNIRWLTQDWCINANKRLLWPNATQVGEYDVVADFGNNVADPIQFAPDDSFDPPNDLIDGYINAGFRIVPDPATDTSFGNAGHFWYDETTQGSLNVIGDEHGAWTTPLRASVWFPADVGGATTPGQTSASQASFPLVVVVHGNGADTGYQGYEYLLEHFAKNGFIAASIYMNVCMGGTGRARVLHKHLDVLFSLFGAHVANNIGIMGHSRGGEGVVIAARLNNQEAWGYNLNAVVSLAPTDQYTSETFAGAWAKPYLVIYGSLDGDLAENWDCGFSLYDRASGMQKSMAFVYGACHDRFNTVWGDNDIHWGKLGMNDINRVITADAHKAIAKGYMTAFYRQYLRAENQWAGIFKGEWVPAAITIADPRTKIYMQYEDTTVRTIDDFEGVHTATSWQTSAIGGTVTQSGLPATPVENKLNTIDTHSPHVTSGLKLRWDNVGDSLTYAVPAGQRDVSPFEALSFRITQVVNSASNPIGQAQDVRATLTDGNGNSRGIRVSKIAEIPWPDMRDIDIYRKSAMCTIRIPMRSYTIKCLNIAAVDITNVTSLTFDFSEIATGEIEIDSVQFTA